MTAVATRKRISTTFALVALLDGGLAIVSLLYLMSTFMGRGEYSFIAPFFLLNALSAWLSSRLARGYQVSASSRSVVVALRFAVLGSYVLSFSQFRGEFDLPGIVWGLVVGPVMLIAMIFCLVRLAHIDR